MQSIWMTVADALEDLIRRFGLGRIVIGMSAVAGAAAGLGLAVDEAVLLVISAAALVALLLLTVLAQALDRSRLSSRVDDLSRVIDRYANELVAKQTAESFTIDEWLEHVTVTSGGDARIVKWFTLHVGDAPLDAFWHRQYKTERTKSRAYQDKVRVEARSFASGPNGSRVEGARYPVTTTWEGQSLRVFVHLAEVQAPHTTLRVRLRIIWPGFFRELIEDRTVAPVEWTFRRKTRNLSLDMTFARELALRQVFAVDPIGGDAAPEQSVEGGVVTVKYRSAQPPMNKTIGFRLERRR